MIQHNGNGHSKASPLVAVVRDVRHVAHDVVELAELQANLAKAELQGWWKQFIVPVALFVVAALVVSCCVLLLMWSAALKLADAANISPQLALLIVAVAGIVLSAILGGVGLGMLKKAKAPLEESTREFGQNLRWIKTVLREMAKPATTSCRVPDEPMHR